MAPRKSQGNRREGQKDAPKSSTSTVHDSPIVFSKSKDDPKSNKGKGKPVPGALSSAEEPKKQDTRILIGGALWTGKLSVNLLSEHCQRQKWDKPEYTMVNLRFPLPACDLTENSRAELSKDLFLQSS